ncbi:hypothetical protein U9M48_014718, partial [Paspalum notatum var. saurae]
YSEPTANEQLDCALRTGDTGAGAAACGAAAAAGGGRFASSSPDAGRRISLSSATTSFMAGRSSARRDTQSAATDSTCRISCTSASPALALSRASSSSHASRFACTCSRTHCTRCAPPGSVGSSGCRPVRISSATTPKLYTSLFSLIRCIDPYSAYARKRKKKSCQGKNRMKSRETWRHVAVRAGDAGLLAGVVELGARKGHDAGEAEVSEVGLVGRAEQHVHGLDVAVQDGRHAVVVQVRHGVGDAERDVEARAPLVRGRALGREAAVEEPAQAAVGENSSRVPPFAAHPRSRTMLRCRMEPSAAISLRNAADVASSADHIFFTARV